MNSCRGTGRPRRPETAPTPDGYVLIAASGDDVSLPQRALRIREVFEASDAWLVHSHAICIDLRGNEVAPTYLGADFLRGAGLREIATSGSLYLGATAAFRRAVFEKYGYLKNPRAYEDLIYGFRATLENGVRFIDSPLVRYRVGSGISTLGKPVDPAEARRAAVNSLKVQLAVFAQRRRDALLFGLPPSNPIYNSIRKSRIKALLKLIFWKRPAGRVFRRIMLQHPLLALAAWENVRHKMKKLS